MPRCSAAHVEDVDLPLLVPVKVPSLSIQPAVSSRWLSCPSLLGRHLTFGYRAGDNFGHISAIDPLLTRRGPQPSYSIAKATTLRSLHGILLSRTPIYRRSLPSSGEASPMRSRNAGRTSPKKRSCSMGGSTPTTDTSPVVAVRTGIPSNLRPPPMTGVVRTVAVASLAPRLLRCRLHHRESH